VRWADFGELPLVLQRTHGYHALNDRSFRAFKRPHSSQKGNEWHLGLKAHIGVDADSGLLHTVRGTSGDVADVTEGNSLLSAHP
jgi:IS5 family transposase